MQFASRDRLSSGILLAVNGSTPIEQKLAEVLAECDRLREENLQLRERLGMPTEKKPVQPTLHLPKWRVSHQLEFQPGGKGKVVPHSVSRAG
jgi:regulator of replication initiation timing